MVLTVSMLVLTLVLTVLTISITSRRVSARYAYFYGLYDLAVAGNEQAYFFIRQGIYHHS